MSVEGVLTTGNQSDASTNGPGPFIALALPNKMVNLGLHGLDKTTVSRKQTEEYGPLHIGIPTGEREWVPYWFLDTVASVGWKTLGGQPLSEHELLTEQIELPENLKELENLLAGVFSQSETEFTSVDGIRLPIGAHFPSSSAEGATAEAIRIDKPRTLLRNFVRYTVAPYRDLLDKDSFGLLKQRLLRLLGKLNLSDQDSISYLELAGRLASVSISLAEEAGLPVENIETIDTSELFLLPEALDSQMQVPEQFMLFDLWLRHRDVCARAYDMSVGPKDKRYGNNNDMPFYLVIDGYRCEISFRENIARIDMTNLGKESFELVNVCSLESFCKHLRFQLQAQHPEISSKISLAPTKLGVVLALRIMPEVSPALAGRKLSYMDKAEQWLTNLKEALEEVDSLPDYFQSLVTKSDISPIHFVYPNVLKMLEDLPEAQNVEMKLPTSGRYALGKSTIRASEINDQYLSRLEAVKVMLSGKSKKFDLSKLDNARDFLYSIQELESDVEGLNAAEHELISIILEMNHNCEVIDDLENLMSAMKSQKSPFNELVEDLFALSEDPYEMILKFNAEKERIRDELIHRRKNNEPDTDIAKGLGVDSIKKKHILSVLQDYRLDYVRGLATHLGIPLTVIENSVEKQVSHKRLKESILRLTGRITSQVAYYFWIHYKAGLESIRKLDEFPSAMHLYLMFGEDVFIKSGDYVQVKEYFRNTEA